jgi:hypothetical protein
MTFLCALARDFHAKRFSREDAKIRKGAKEKVKYVSLVIGELHQLTDIFNYYFSAPGFENAFLLKVF